MSDEYERDVCFKLELKEQPIGESNWELKIEDDLITFGRRYVGLQYISNLLKSKYGIEPE